MPCPFLDGDNLCSIYDVRPKACREFPHTDRKKIYQINHLTIKNTLTCPAAYLFVEKLKDRCNDIYIFTFDLDHTLLDFDTAEEVALTQISPRSGGSRYSSL